MSVTAKRGLCVGMMWTRTTRSCDVEQLLATIDEIDKIFRETKS